MWKNDEEHESHPNHRLASSKGNYRRESLAIIGGASWNFHCDNSESERKKEERLSATHDSRESARKWLAAKAQKTLMTH
jgi:hypothetical protein